MRFEIDMLRRVAAAVICVVGVCAVLYVAYVAPYLHPDYLRAELVLRDWGLFVSGMFFVLIGSVLWATTFSSEGRNDSEERDDEEDEHKDLYPQA